MGLLRLTQLPSCHLQVYHGRRAGLLQWLRGELGFPYSPSQGLDCHWALGVVSLSFDKPLVRSGVPRECAAGGGQLSPGCESVLQEGGSSHWAAPGRLQAWGVTSGWATTLHASAAKGLLLSAPQDGRGPAHALHAAMGL